ncbi:phage tail assembly chaperone [Stutzerimonas nitrititolerans]|uniref:phage tail assembly chaperone n=1 Tax=Stutzerimonas nitrititolerans TaxID=2482751 RepID=UPI0028B2195B|nr:hypothetical protein [Stutzerimonas nitrititolerans]
MLKPSGPRPKKGPDKRITIRAQLEAIAEKTGKRPARLEGPPCPPELSYLWEWYCSARPIESLAELKAWADLYGRKLKPHEITLLRRLASLEDRVASA